MPTSRDARQSRGWGRELLARLALMRGTGYPLPDMAQRLSMDMGLEIPEEVLRTLLVALGLESPNTWTPFVRALIAAEVPPSRIEELLHRLRREPAQTGFDLADLGVPETASLYAGLPKALCVPARASHRLALGARAGELSPAACASLLERTGLPAAAALKRLGVPPSHGALLLGGAQMQRGLRFNRKPLSA